MAPAGKTRTTPETTSAYTGVPGTRLLGHIQGYWAIYEVSGSYTRLLGHIQGYWAIYRVIGHVQSYWPYTRSLGHKTRLLEPEINKARWHQS